MRLDIANIRKDYKLQSLNESDCANNPFDQFEKWWQQAIHSEIEEVNAMTLATATKTGSWASPQSRLIKNREELELAVQKFTQQYEGGFIPRPDFWGGYCVKAVMMEF
jgi:pyridoxamine 5'-phosphate oxidase